VIGLDPASIAARSLNLAPISVTLEHQVPDPGPVAAVAILVPGRTVLPGLPGMPWTAGPTRGGGAAACDAGAWHEGGTRDLSHLRNPDGGKSLCAELRAARGE
jgi:hypothetical protein